MLNVESATAAPNRLQREFTVAQPDLVWVTDITYIRTHEGWLYLTAVIDLYSRSFVGLSMSSTMANELVLDALMMAVWRKRPKAPVMIHSDQGSPFGRDAFNRWCKDTQLLPGMSRRGACCLPCWMTAAPSICVIDAASLPVEPMTASCKVP